MINWDNYAEYNWKQLREIATDVADFVEDVLSRLRKGVYDEERDGDLLAVLEEIERILR